MLYSLITINGKDYRCRLSTRNAVELERKMGKNPLNIFMKMADGNVYPNLDDMMMIFHASLQKYHHGITLEEAYNIFDEYVDEGHTLIDFIPFILEIFQNSGFIPKETEEDSLPNEQKAGERLPPLGKRLLTHICLWPYKSVCGLMISGIAPQKSCGCGLRPTPPLKREKQKKIA